MINHKRILGVIPARGGSKGVPRKNVREVRGRPLIAWTVDAAQKSRLIDRSILTSEDPEIIETALRLGLDVPFVRPIELASDETPVSEAVLHAIETVSGYDYVAVLQVTTPLRLSQDIDGCIEKCVLNCAESCVSVVQVEQNPYWMCKIDDRGYLMPFQKSIYNDKRRQDIPDLFIPNGAVYVVDCAFLIKNRTLISDKTLGYKMEKERSLDIDTELDFMLFELLLNGY